MQIDRFCEGLLNFLQASPTPFHAVQTMALALEQTGFEYLDEAKEWNFPRTGNYYTIRNDASIIAFRLGDGSVPAGAKNTEGRLGFNMVGAHTDSPGLKVKPTPDRFKEGYWQLGVEVYGAPLLHTWFDRDLSLAGRVHYIDENNGLYRTLVDFEQPIATIPSLAIHLNREANDKSSINAQQHILPVLMQTENPEAFSLKRALLERIKLCTDHNPHEVLDYDLYLYDTQAPRSTGFAQEFIASARLDNLLSCYVGLMSLLNSDPSQRSLFVCNDHEEVGSQSACGAQGPFLADTLKRLFPDHETYCQCIAQSFLISVDNAHAIHPNYADRHDPMHAPKMNHGPAIKINANQRYATTSETSAVVQYLAQVVNVPLQSFVSRSDLACGSTIGPLTSAELGVRTVDMGIPQFAMHSTRELASKADTHALYTLLNAFFSLPTVPSAQAIRPEISKPSAITPETPELESEPEAEPELADESPISSYAPQTRSRGYGQNYADAKTKDNEENTLDDAEYHTEYSVPSPDDAEDTPAPETAIKAQDAADTSTEQHVNTDQLETSNPSGSSDQSSDTTSDKASTEASDERASPANTSDDDANSDRGNNRGGRQRNNRGRQRGNDRRQRRHNNHRRADNTSANSGTQDTPPDAQSAQPVSDEQTHPTAPNAQDNYNAAEKSIATETSSQLTAATDEPANVSKADAGTTHGSSTALGSNTEGNTNKDDMAKTGESIQTANSGLDSNKQQDTSTSQANSNQEIGDHAAKSTDQQTSVSPPSSEQASRTEVNETPEKLDKTKQLEPRSDTANEVKPKNEDATTDASKAKPEVTSQEPKTGPEPSTAEPSSDDAT